MMSIEHLSDFMSETVIRRRRIQIYDLRAHNIDALRYNIAMQDWNYVLLDDNIEISYDTFLNIIRHLK